MSNNPFTLDMFGSSALSSGLGLGVTAFCEVRPAVNDDEPDPTPPSPSLMRVGVVKPTSAIRRQGDYRNFYLDDEDRGLASTWKERAKQNIAAQLSVQHAHSCTAQ